MTKLSGGTPVAGLLEDMGKPGQIRFMAEDVIRKHWYAHNCQHDPDLCPRCKEAQDRITKAEADIEALVRKWVEENPSD